MSTMTYRTGYGDALGLTPWEEWVTEVGASALESAQWAARTLAQAVLVALAWPLRMAWLLVRQAHWGSGETVFCTMLATMWAGMLMRLFSRVVWPTWEQALADLQQVSAVLLVAWLVLYLRAGVGSSRSCCTARSCGAHRNLVPSPDGTKTWRWIVAVHEAGHLVVGKKLHRRTGKAKLKSGGGVTMVFPNHRDMVGEIAIDMAGGFAAGTQAGCDGDRANAQWRLRRFVEPKRHGQVMRAGTAKARSLVAAHRGEILVAARQIYDRGWTR